MTGLKWIKRASLGALFLCAAFYLAICGYMYFMQRTLQYRPDSTRIAPATAGLATAQEIIIPTQDGEKLVAWWIAPRDERQPVYLYLHGNAGNLARRSARLARLVQNGAGVLAPSWRGYSGSTGQPSETGFHADAAAGYAWLTAKIPAERLVIIGESIGSGPAVNLASAQRAAALALDSPFDSALSVAQERYSWLPVSFLMHDQYRSDLRASRVAMPGFIGHCRHDPTIPLHAGQRLAAMFKTRVQFDIFDSTCHPAPYGRFIDAMEQFLNSLGLPRQ